MPQNYYAKSPNADGTQETVHDHCQKVSELASQYGTPLELKEESRLCGLYHDFGKYSRSFQGVLNRTHSNIDHAFSSAVLCYLFTQGNFRTAPEVINGHHDGLKDFGFLENYIKQNLKSEEKVYCNAQKESALSGPDEYAQAIKVIQTDFPSKKDRSYRPTIPQIQAQDNLSAMLDTRMLFSCLVDADYTVSADQADIQHDLDTKTLLDALYAHCQKLRKNSGADPQLNDLRNYLFERCGQMGEDAAPGLFTLTAPTGTGKTLALLHFALRHCKSHPEMRRIILVLPFLTLTEQSANAYQNIIPDILQDHSQSEPDETTREHAAKWDSPFIITTSVKFFQALFAQRPTDCRKLHNIANSVILFDEAQSLPAHLTRVTLGAIDRLCTRFGCTMVLSTATQPDYSALKPAHWSPREILPVHTEMFRQTQRTHIIWKLGAPTPLEDIAQQMIKSENVCAIVNLRAHARKLYRVLKEQCGQEGSYFLTTDLCPAHRTEMVAEIRQRQKAGLVCRVVSTQCIEAGVDLDFDTLYRALAPLEAIIQAAGRCNRNGRSAVPGNVTVFIPDTEGRLYPDDWYMTCAEFVKTLLHKKRNDLQIQDPECIKEYYDLIFEHQLDKPALTDAIKKRDYEITAREYQLISRGGHKVLVPYAGHIELYRQLCQEAKDLGVTGSWLRRAAPITVTTFERLEQKDLAFPVERLHYSRKRGSSCIPADVWILCTGSETQYQPDMGLQLTKTEAEDYIIGDFMA